jgi:hypothetical protein
LRAAEHPLLQALAIERGDSDGTARSLLHRRLSLHYGNRAADKAMDCKLLALLTCVAEWESGLVASVLPCFLYQEHCLVVHDHPHVVR